MRDPDEVRPDRGVPEGGIQPPPKFEVKIDKKGRLKLPPEILDKLGAGSGSCLQVLYEDNRVLIEPDIQALRRLYIEPTSGCNLKCQTCIRNTWSEPFGVMNWDLFEKIAVELKSWPHLQSIMLAGFGEPLFHPDIVRNG